MPRRRYEILLPTRYNDGSPVEPERFFETQEELVTVFGALTTSPDLFRGTWMHEGQRFEDEHFRMIVDNRSHSRKPGLFREIQGTIERTVSPN
jgi:hypothetical protein